MEKSSVTSLICLHESERLWGGGGGGGESAVLCSRPSEEVLAYKQETVRTVDVTAPGGSGSPSNIKHAVVFIKTIYEIYNQDPVFESFHQNFSI